MPVLKDILVIIVLYKRLFSESIMCQSLNKNLDEKFPIQVLFAPRLITQYLQIFPCKHRFIPYKHRIIASIPSGLCIAVNVFWQIGGYSEKILEP